MRINENFITELGGVMLLGLIGSNMAVYINAPILAMLLVASTVLLGAAVVMRYSKRRGIK